MNDQTQKVLHIACGNRTEAFKYLEDAKEALDPNAVQIGVRPLNHLVKWLILNAIVVVLMPQGELSMQYCRI